MSVENVQDAKFDRCLVHSGLKLASLTKTVVNAEAILGTYPPVLYLDAAGAVSNPLPDEATYKDFTFFVRNNSATAVAITLQDSTGTTTVVAVAQNATAIVHCDGANWQQIG